MAAVGGGGGCRRPAPGQFNIFVIKNFSLLIRPESTTLIVAPIACTTTGIKVPFSAGLMGDSSGPALSCWARMSPLGMAQRFSNDLKYNLRKKFYFVKVKHSPFFITF
jgi:hypothetical protein